MNLLVFCASIVVLGGLLWVLQLLVANSADDPPIHWRQLLLAAVWLVASSILMVYLTR
jgi:hypothetical protein